ncbi:MAG: caspase family protein, partial [Muribaculum sp.]|nr:caspase family protein [Muribaculum sp.]
MKGKALVIGIDKYNEVDTITQLDKAVADAMAIAEKLRSLGFDVTEKYDITSHEYDAAKDQFIDSLNGADIGVFFFAGHGLEYKGQNILLTKDTIASTGNADTLKRYAILLQDLVNEMHNVCDANIVIIDACRQTYVEKTRGTSTASIAPMYAPKGTLLAFSTSSGETAGEGKVDSPHSNYTTALLKHLDEPNLEIERLFKKVRTTLHTITNGKQTSWEHTSLIGNFIFNAVNPNNNKSNKIYSEDAIADKNWADHTIGSIIEKFKKHNWYDQNQAIEDLKNLKKLTANQLFVVGRNILQS